jgi:hypothetical protein
MAHAAQVILPTEAEAVAPTGLELVISKALDPIEVFTSNGLDPILERIERETLSIALDMSSAKGRKEIASLAHKVAVSKTTLDKLGKDLVSGWKDKAKKVDAERARAWDRLEVLQKQVRQPLTEWEEADKQRVERHEANLAEIVNSGPFTLQNWQTLSVEVMRDRLAEVQKDAELDWQEFSVKARAAIESTSKAINSAIEKRASYDAEQSELARLRNEEAERKQRDHEERLKAEAAEAARKASEEKAKRQAEVEAKRVAMEKAQAEAERLRIQRQKEDAETRAAKAEADRIAVEQKAAHDKELAEQRAAQAEHDRIAAEKKAKDDARIAAERAATEKKAAEEAAALRERHRIEAQQIAVAVAAAKREADKKHQAAVHNAALQALAPAMAFSCAGPYCCRH